MQAVKLTPDELEAYLPHRGPNLLPDEVEIADDGRSARSTTAIPPDDPRGRDLFARRDADGRRCWYEPFLGELLALTGVPLLKPKLDATGQVAVFSTISRLDLGDLIPMADEVIGSAVITRERSDFTQFGCRIHHGDSVCYDAEILSGAATLSEIAAGAIRPLGDPAAGDAVDPGDFAWKDPRMRFVDRVLEWDADRGRLVAAYTYPTDHPLVPGHFPGAPLMMGMSQWAAVGDAAWLAARRLGGDGRFRAQGSIVRPDGAPVVGVRDLILAVERSVPRIASTKRLAFRDVIRPGDGLHIEVEVAPC